MGEFASFVLTKKDIFYLQDSNSFEDIIDHYQLKEDIVRVELIPPQDIDDVIYTSKWKFEADIVDSPNWNYKILEERARLTLAKRIVKEKIGYKIFKKDNSLVNVGHYGRAVTGKSGIAIAGNYGEAISGDYGKSITFDYGRSITGNYGRAESKCGGLAVSGYLGKSTVGEYGQAISGEYGLSTSGHDGRSIAGDDGQAITGDLGEAIVGAAGIAIAGKEGIASAGVSGKAKAGKGGEIQIKYENSKNLRIYTLIGRVGYKGIRANTFYKVLGEKFVRS